MDHLSLPTAPGRSCVASTPESTAPWSQPARGISAGCVGSLLVSRDKIILLSSGRNPRSARLGLLRGKVNALCPKFGAINTTTLHDIGGNIMKLLAGVALALSQISFAAPSTKVAKRCLHYAYIAYPFRRPGSGPMSGDRQIYIRDCFAKNGEVPVPTPPPTATPRH
jgi:hypothetical protein